MQNWCNRIILETFCLFVSMLNLMCFLLRFLNEKKCTAGWSLTARIKELVRWKKIGAKFRQNVVKYQFTL